MSIHASGMSIPLSLLIRLLGWSDVNSFFDPTGVPVRVSIMKLYLVPKLVHQEIEQHQIKLIDYACENGVELLLGT